MDRKTKPMSMNIEQRRELESWVRARTTPQRVVLRSRICLLAAEGLSNTDIARKVNTTRPTVLLWRKRFQEQGPAGLIKDAPKGPSTRRLEPVKIKAIVEATLHTVPEGATHWSTRSMAKAQGVCHNLVAQIWRAHGLQPHRIRTFKLSKDKRFVEKLVDVVGLYLDPPDKALVLCLDEKSQIQALDRTQPGLPLKRGRCGTMTHDYKRNGTTCLFAALNVLDGKVIGECHGRHRHQEWLRFLRRLDREFPSNLKLHLVMDNYGTHKEPHVQSWLKKHPRFVCHFVPTSSSWLNLVERWFRELTDKAVRRGSFASVPDLKQAIDEFMSAWNDNPKPFVWTATVEDIVKKIARARAKMEQIKPGSTQPRGKKKPAVL